MIHVFPLQDEMARRILMPDHYLITQVGIQSWKRNHDTLDALQLVPERAPRPRRLFVGGNPTKQKILRAKANP